MKESLSRCILYVIILCIPSLSCFARRTKITVATLNIRVEQKKDSLNRWNDRKSTIYRFVRQKHIDIIGLQEVYPKPLDDIENSLKEFAFIERVNKEQKADNPILYRQSVFACQDKGTFWLSQFPDSVGFVGWDGRHPRFVNWVVLQHKKTGNTFCFVNTHLDNAGEQAREEGIKLIKSRLAEKTGSYPIILVGDFNSSEKESPYQIALHDGFEMKDLYFEAKKRKGVDYTYHAFGHRELSKRRRIDYLFATEGVCVRKVNIPRERLKSKVYMSDHCPVVAKIWF